MPTGRILRRSKRTKTCRRFQNTHHTPLAEVSLAAEGTPYRFARIVFSEVVRSGTFNVYQLVCVCGRLQERKAF